MSTRTVLFPPPTRSAAIDEKGYIATPFRQWLFTLQMLLPLVVVDTSGGPVTLALPPAGLNSSTGQSNQNQELLYVKGTADGNNLTVTGAINGSQSTAVQFAFLRFKSDGTNWWALSIAGGGGSTPTFEIPAGPINGSNTGFTLTHPYSVLILVSDGFVLIPTVGFTLVGTVLTMAVAPVTSLGVWGWV